jgi:hypothetical protein
MNQYGPRWPHAEDVNLEHDLTVQRAESADLQISKSSYSCPAMFELGPKLAGNRAFLIPVPPW